MSFWIPEKPRRDPIFETPSEMWERCCLYFDYAKENPLIENKIFQFQGSIVEGQVQKPRAMTIKALCVHLGCSKDTWENYRKREGYSEVCELVDSIIYTQKFELAAADLLNAGLIGRDLGLTDKTVVDHQSTDGSMTPTRIELVAPSVNGQDRTTS